MKNYSEILDGNEKSFEELKKQINPILYQQLLLLYNEQKTKILIKKEEQTFFLL